MSTDWPFPTVTEIELISIGGPRDQSWPHGSAQITGTQVDEVADALAQVRADAVLCLTAAAPVPEPDLLERLLAGPADVWHAGLRLGLGGHPRVLDYVQPQWMLTTPVDPSAEVTSPLLSLRAVLIRRTVLEQLGGLDRSFTTLSGAGLEAGVRWTRAGALIRHVPELVPVGTEPCTPPSQVDGLRIILGQFGRKWAIWALGRSIRHREISAGEIRSALGVIRDNPPPAAPHYRTPHQNSGDTQRTVSVILPTIDRYSYLEPLLHQLSGQTRPPHQVLIVDQTPHDRRRDDLSLVAPRLPVEIHALDTPGQSTARNLAIGHATGEALLFIDDDDEIPDDLIEQHLLRLSPGVDAICGGVDDATAGPPPPGFRHRRASDVFPTNNTLLRREALTRSGLFDPVFDRGPRADRDIGTRLHLSGAMMVYDPSVMIFHHHAPAGGLRTHGARRVTRASARRSLTVRHLPALTELYIGMRYYTRRQQQEMRLLRMLSALSGEGQRNQRAMRMVVQASLQPSTYRHILRTEREARRLMSNRPEIPSLPAPPETPAP